MTSEIKMISNQAQIIYASDAPRSAVAATNASVTALSGAQLLVRKKSTCCTIGVGEKYRYWLCVSNMGAEAVEEVVITDLCDEAQDFVAGSVTVDGVEQPEADMVQGLALAAVAAGEFIVISYQARVQQKPEQGAVESTAQVVYRCADNTVGRAESNTVTVEVRACALLLVALMDLAMADCGETITCSGYVTNTGNFPAENIVLKLTIPGGTEFGGNSLLINGGRPCGSWSCEQIPLGNLSMGQSVIFSYQLQVTTRQTRQTADRLQALYRCVNGCSHVLSSNIVVNALELNPCVSYGMPGLYRAEE